MDSTISVSTATYDGYDLATALQTIHDLGVNFVELVDIAGHSETFDERNLDRSHAEQARDQLANYNLQCRCLSAHMDLSSPDAVEAMGRRLTYPNRVGAARISGVS